MIMFIGNFMEKEKIKENILIIIIMEIKKVYFDIIMI